jgi:hypothetical protein
MTPLCVWPASSSLRARQLHRQVGHPAVLADVEDLNDVGVLQPRHRLALASEAGALLRPGMKALEDGLQGDDAVQADLACQVDDAHAAAPQRAEHLVPGQYGPGTRAPRQRVLAGRHGWKRGPGLALTGPQEPAFQRADALAVGAAGRRARGNGDYWHGSLRMCPLPRALQ